MKKTVKKLAAVGLTLTSVMSLVACGNTSGASNDNENKEITKPTSFKVMMDGTVVTESNGGLEFRKQLEEALDLVGCIEWVQPDHASYYDTISQVFNSESTMPDVVILSSDYYALYAANGMLWDMTDAWDASETKSSGRLISTAQNVIESLQVNGEDGTKAMYGFSPYRGNGCLTYVKTAWLEAAGMTKSDVEGKSLTFAEYYDMLKKMAAAKGHYVISAPGFVSSEAPYTNYLPEFFQDAQYTFYQNSTGEYVDGFTEDAMKNALQRIATAVSEGIIDRESVNNTTANARDKFRSTDAGAESGVFTYWAGTWSNTLRNYLSNAKLDNDLIELQPIKELGTYVERLAPCWAITSSCSNPEGVFKYFIDTMLDGGDVQTLWTYGAKGVHWDNVAETYTQQGKEDKPITTQEGEFHFLPSPEKPQNLMSKNHIDPTLSLATFTNGDPGAAKLTEVAKASEEYFAANSTIATPLPMTEDLGANIGDINTARNYVIANVALGQLTLDEGMAYYTEQVGKNVETVLKSLNK